jgi:hypothetical protein
MSRRAVPDPTSSTLRGASSIAFRLKADPEHVRFADVVKCDRGEEAVVLKPWGWKRRLLALPFDAFKVAVPSTCGRRSAQAEIGAAQAPLEGDPLWPPR